MRFESSGTSLGSRPNLYRRVRDIQTLDSTTLPQPHQSHLCRLHTVARTLDDGNWGFSHQVDGDAEMAMPTSLPAFLLA